MILYKFSEDQVAAKNFVEGRVHEMCHVAGYGSLSFRPKFDWRFRRIKIYQVLCHEILSVIQKQTLDDMPTTIFTVRTRLKQMRTLLNIWTAMTAVERERRLQGIRLEITIQTEKIIHGRQIMHGHRNNKL